jgi:hypothetical protein
MWVWMMVALVGCGDANLKDSCIAWYEASCECEENSEIACDSSWVETECAEYQQTLTAKRDAGEDPPDGYDSWSEVPEVQACVAKEWGRSCDYDAALEECSAPEAE